MLAVPAAGLSLSDKMRDGACVDACGRGDHGTQLRPQTFVGRSRVGAWRPLRGRDGDAGDLRRPRADCRRSRGHRIGSDGGGPDDVRRCAATCCAGLAWRARVPRGGASRTSTRGRRRNAEAWRIARLADATYEVIGNRRDGDGGCGARGPRSRLCRSRHRRRDERGGARGGRRLRRCALARWRSRRPVCVIASGETTVQVAGTGRGGRNQEFALGALRRASSQRTAGARSRWPAPAPTASTARRTPPGRSSTSPRARGRGALAADAEAALADNGAYDFFGRSAIDTWGPTGTNVGDLQRALARRWVNLRAFRSDCRRTAAGLYNSDA